MIFRLRQHIKELQNFEEESELQKNENKKIKTAKKIATLKLGIGSKNMTSTCKQPKVD